MKISELIEKLNLHKEALGDVDIRVNGVVHFRIAAQKDLWINDFGKGIEKEEYTVFTIDNQPPLTAKGLEHYEYCKRKGYIRP